MEYVASALVLKERPHTTSNDNSEFRKVYLAISLTTTYSAAMISFLFVIAIIKKNYNNNFLTHMIQKQMS